MLASKFLAPSAWSLRLSVICLVAMSTGLPIAWISLGKVLLFVGSLGFILIRGLQGQSIDSGFQQLWTPRYILLVLAYFTASLLWTPVDNETSLAVLVKHSKLLEVVLLLCLIQTRREARIGIGCFAVGQFFLLASSWALAFGMPVPWRTSTSSTYVVFSSYLDQSIIFATSAAIFWHLKLKGIWPQWMGAFLAAAALINVLFLLEGRTGHLVALAMISATLMWYVPKRFRVLTAILVPITLLLALSFGSPKTMERLSRVVTESKNYTDKRDSSSSSGWRLNAWERSAQAIKESPWIGHGVGSWTTTIKRIQGASAAAILGSNPISNPHQEYLLWGVEIGVLGIFLLPLLAVVIIRDSRQFDYQVKRAIYAIVIAIAIACLFNSSLYDALMGDYFCIALGLLMALGLRDGRESLDVISVKKTTYPR